MADRGRWNFSAVSGLDGGEKFLSVRVIAWSHLKDESG